MTTDTNAFSKATTGAGSEADQTPTASDTSSKPSVNIPPEVAELIGEGKKYANIEAALKSIPHAQNHIKQLEAETEDLRSRKVDVEEILATMGKQSTTAGETSEIDEDEVANRVLAKLSAKEQEAVKANNLTEASNHLATKAGSVDAAALLIIEKAKELGLSPNALQRIAEASPKAFLAYFNETLPTNTDKQPLAKGTTNAAAFTQGQPKVTEGTYAWYSEQRKAKGDKWYFSEATTKSRMNDMNKLGNEKFFGKQH
jgi:hypothetical protein